MSEGASVAMAIGAAADVERARREARRLAGVVRFSPADAEAVVLAVSELATNLVRYAPGGVVSMAIVSADRGSGIRIESRDEGPGIADVERALRDGFSTGGGLGGGLGGVRRLMDAFAIATGPAGTIVEATKWATQR